MRRSYLDEIKSERVELVRGRGLLNAVVIKPTGGIEAWDVCLKMKELGLLAKPTHGHIIRCVETPSTQQPPLSHYTLSLVVAVARTHFRSPPRHTLLTHERVHTRTHSCS